MRKSPLFLRKSVRQRNKFPASSGAAPSSVFRAQKLRRGTRNTSPIRSQLFQASTATCRLISAIREHHHHATIPRDFQFIYTFSSAFSALPLASATSLIKRCQVRLRKAPVNSGSPRNASASVAEEMAPRRVPPLYDGKYTGLAQRSTKLLFVFHCKLHVNIALPQNIYYAH